MASSSLALFLAIVLVGLGSGLAQNITSPTSSPTPSPVSPTRSPVSPTSSPTPTSSPISPTSPTTPPPPSGNGGTPPRCFPGDALIQMYTGEMMAMKDLNIGDKIATGKGSFSEVYAYGHRDSNVISEFVQVKAETNTLELTPGHFVPISFQEKMVYKRAEELKVGDVLYTTSGVSKIKDISKVEKLGLYNPLTLSGTILVNDVVASVHSEWFLDSLFDALGATEYLPYAYQTLLAPIRALYKVAGNKLYSTGYAMLDSVLNVADFGTKYGGSIALGLGLGALAVASRSMI